MASPLAQGHDRQARIDPALEHIRGEIAEYFPDMGHGSCTVRVIASTRRAYSEIYRISAEGPNGKRRELIIKAFGQAETQFRALTWAWPHFAAHSTWKIPRPLDFIAEPSALVLESASGRSLEASIPMLAWSNTRLARATADLRRAGMWLRFYHGLGDQQEAKPLDVETRWKSFEEALEGLINAAFSRRLCADFAARLRPFAEEAALRPIPVSNLHGDFKLDNVLVDGAVVTVLDVWGEPRNAVDHDLASFLSSLLLLRLTRPLPTPAFRRLGRDFLQGYFGHDTTQRNTAIPFLGSVGLADVCLEILGRPHSTVAQAWIKRRLAQTIAALPGVLVGIA